MAINAIAEQFVKKFHKWLCMTGDPGNAYKIQQTKMFNHH